MTYKHEIYQEFAKEIGCASVPQAISKFPSVTKYKEAFYRSKAYINRHCYKELDFNPNYVLYNDGRCFSNRMNRFLRPRKTQGKTPNKEHFTYDLKPLGTTLITRLVMYYFGKHQYQSIAEMPKVIQLDNDNQNWHISNLAFASQSDINKKHGIKPPKKIIDTNTDHLEIITQMLKNKHNYKDISCVLNISIMSVYRLIKKHQLKQ